MGSHYNQIIKSVEAELIENTTFSAFLITGSSGTGKSRILQECRCPLLKYGYRILELNVTQEHITNNLVKEIIYFLYQVPSELISEVLNTRLSGKMNSEWDTDMSLADKIAKMVMALTEDTLDKFINEYSEIIFEKMAKDKIAIIIDNIQFSSDCFQQFWRRYITYSVNQCRENKSIIFISVNLDYMTAETAKTINTIQNSNIRHLVDKTINGFSTINQGILFLRELIHVNSEKYDSLFKEIIETVSLNPFNLYQMIKLMEEDGVIKNLPNKQGYIFTTEARWKTTWKFPKNINDVLKRRLTFAEKEIGTEKFYNILSACYLLEIIEAKKAKLLNIDMNDLDLLCQHQILAQDKSGYTFVHDIFRKYFNESCSEKRLWCLKKINLLDARVLQYDTIYTLTRLCVLKETDYIIKFCQKHSLDNIPIRIRGVILESLFDECIISKSAFHDIRSWIGSLTWLCECSRNLMGSSKSLEFYDRAYNYIDNIFDNFSAISCSELRHLLHSYCDIFIQMHRRSSAIDFAERVLSKLTLLPIENQSEKTFYERIDEYYVLKAIMYNRIFCAYNNALPTMEIVFKRNEAIKKSREFIPLIQDEHKKNLISYLNNSDEGYRYYGFFSDYDKLMQIWNKCLVNIPVIAPEKTMNYYRKCVQCTLIKQDEEKTKLYIKEGLHYLNCGTYSHEPLIFNTFFIMAEIINYLQHSPQEMYYYIEELLNKLVKLQLLLKSDKMGDIYMLRGINAFYSNDIPTVYYAFKKAFQIYNEKETTNYWFKRELVKENIVTAYSAFSINKNCYDISFLPDEYIEKLFIAREPDFCAKGIIRTGDYLFNLPLIV